MRTSFVDANYRFIAANQEITARIVQRQQAISIYVTIIVSLLAALVALRPTTALTDPPIEWLLPGFPVSSMCFAFLNYKAERALTNLRTFLSELECLNNSHSELPGYNTDLRWALEANSARRFHDHAMTTLVLGGNAIGLGAAWAIYPFRLSTSLALLYGSVALAVLSIAILLMTPKWRYLPTNRAV